MLRFLIRNAFSLPTWGHGPCGKECHSSGPTRRLCLWQSWRMVKVKASTSTLNKQDGRQGPTGRNDGDRATVPSSGWRDDRQAHGSKMHIAVECVRSCLSALLMEPWCLWAKRDSNSYPDMLLSDWKGKSETIQDMAKWVWLLLIMKNQFDITAAGWVDVQSFRLFTEWTH